MRVVLAVCLASITVVMCAFCCLPACAEREGDGHIKVYNNSDHEIYVVIGGYNQGRIWKRSSETYQFKFGSHKVEAEVGDETASDWVNITPGSPTDEVTFENDDFPDVPVRTK